MLLPPAAIRRDFVRAMLEAFDDPRLADVRAAFAPVCAFYGVPVPRFRWLRDHERRDRYAYMIRQHSRTTVALMRPEQWGRQRRRAAPKDAHGWCAAALHEFDHVLKIPRAEDHADAYAAAFLMGAE